MGEGKTWKMFIGGEWTDSSTAETEPDINPATGGSVATVQVGTREDDGRKGLVTIGSPSKFEEKDHFESFVTRESIRFMKNHGAAQPFLLVASYLKPHDPFTPANEAGLAAVVALGAAMALFSRYRVTNPVH